MDSKKDALLDSMKPILPQTLSAVRLLERCISDTETGSLQSDTAVDTARVLVGLHQQIVSAVEGAALDTEGNRDAARIVQFVHGEFKRTILLLGEALKLALQSNDAGGLSQHTQDFRNHPRTLVNMIRSAQLGSTSNDINDKPLSFTQGVLPTAPGRGPKRIARSLSDGKISKVDDPDALLEDFREEFKNRNAQKNKKEDTNGKINETKVTKSSHHKSNHKKGSKKRSDKKSEESSKVENSRRAEVSRRTEDTRRMDESRVEESRGETSKREGSKSRRDKKVDTSSVGKSKEDFESEKSKPSKSSSRKTTSGSSRSRRPMEESERSTTNTKKKSGNSASSKTKKPRRPTKEERDARREKRKSMPTPAKRDLDDFEGVKRRRTKIADITTYIGFDTDPGKRYGKVNQDAYLYCTSGKHGHITAVFDGHGVNGEIAAQTAKETFETYFKKHDLFGTKSKEKQNDMIREVFILAHENIIKKYEELTVIKWEGHKFNLVQVKDLMMYQNKKYGVLLQDFGTTAVMAAVKSQPIGEGALEVIVANAGDSIAFIGREDGDTLIPVEGLCTVHNGNNVIEEDRILSLGSVKKEGHYVSPPEESGFGWAQLAVTRSLGHKYFSKYGIIPDPDISDYKLEENDRFLVVTSDGVTDVFKSEEVLDALEEFYEASAGNLQKATVKLVKHSVGMWKKKFVDARGKGEAADNTTAIVVDLKKIICPQ